MPITPEQARAELARRAAERQAKRTQTMSSFLGEPAALTGAAFREAGSFFPSGGSTPVGAMKQAVGAVQQLAPQLTSPFQQPAQSPAGRIATLGMKAGGIGLGLMTGGKAAGQTTLGRGAKFFLSPRTRTGLAEKARQTLEEVRSGAGPALETELSQIPGSVNLRPIIDSFLGMRQNQTIQEALSQAIAKAAAAGDDTLARFMDRPSLANTASALDAHKIAVSLEQIPETHRLVTILRKGGAEKGAKFVQRSTPRSLDFLQTAQTIRQQIGQSVGPAFETARQKFGQTASAVRELEPMFSREKLTKNILTGFGGFGGGETRKLVKQTLPETMTKQLFAVPQAGLLAAAPAIPFLLKKLFPAYQTVQEARQTP